MAQQAGLFGRSNRAKKLLATEEFLPRVNRFVAWEAFRPTLGAALQRKDGDQGGRLPYDTVLMFKVLVLQALYNLSDEETVYQILDRQSFMMPSSEIMRRIKGRTSSKLFEEFPHLKKKYWGRHFCARGYFCAKVGQVTEAMIEQYLKHHFEPGPTDDCEPPSPKGEGFVNQRPYVA